MYKFKLSALLLGASMLFGCATPVSAARDSTQLVIALASDPDEGFDPCVGWGRYGSPLIQSTLLTLDHNMDVVLDVATDFAVSDDGFVWSFTLRDDIYFSDQQQLTAHDVAFTYNTAKNAGSVVDLTALAAVVATSDLTVEFTLHQPLSTFLYTVAQTGIVPANYYSDSYYKQPIGSGPFTLLQWDNDQQIILGTNPYYHGEAPHFTQVTILFMTEEAAYLAAQNGLVDLAITNQNFADKPAIEGMTLTAFESIDNRGLTLPYLPDTGLTTAQGYAIGNDVTANLAIRQALNCGIDRDQLILDCLNGYGSAAFSECDGMPWAYSASTKQDINEAIAILEQDGWLLADDGYRYKDGLKASFNLLYSAADSVRQSLSLAVSLQAKQLGIEIKVEGTSWDEIDKKMFSNAVLMGWGAQTPLEGYYLYHSDNMGVDYYNPENYSNPIVDDYYQQALYAVDNSTALSYFSKAQQQVANDLPWLWLTNLDHLYFIADGLSVGTQKIHPHGHAWPVVANLAEWKWE